MQGGIYEIYLKISFDLLTFNHNPFPTSRVAKL